MAEWHYRMPETCWDDLPHHYPHVQLDAFIVMPNHVHGVVTLVDDDVVGPVGAGLRPAPTIMGLVAPWERPARPQKGIREQQVATPRFELGTKGL
jgi:hypothetical protein